MSTPARPFLACPFCKEPSALAANSHLCHDEGCRARDYFDGAEANASDAHDHEPWCPQEVCADPGCEDWRWMFGTEATCPSCKRVLEVEPCDEDESLAELVDAETRENGRGAW